MFKIYISVMGGTCFCPGCKTGYRSNYEELKKEGKKMPSLFRTPKDPEIFQLWQRAIPRADRLLRHKDVVCEKHFKTEDVIYHNKPIKLFDGSIYVHENIRPKLRKGAVPTIFSDVPGHSTYVEKSAKSSKRRKVHNSLVDFSGINITETKEKENVLQTDLSFLPPVILNCITSESHTVLSTLNKITQSLAKSYFSCEPSNSNLLSGDKNNAFEEVFSIKKTNLDSQSKIPKTSSSIVPQSSLSNNSEVTSSQSNLKSNISVEPQVISQSPKLTKDISKSEEINQLSDSQSNVILSETIHEQSSHSITESLAILQPLNPQGISDTENDDSQEQSNHQSDLTDESRNFSQQSSSVESNLSQHPDANFTEPQVSLTPPVVSTNGVDLTESAEEKQWWFNHLKDNAYAIDKMNSWWTVNCLDNFIICARWNSDCSVERKIVIYDDLKVKVFLKEKETTIGNDLEVRSIETISKLVFRVERLRLCKNILSREGDCSRYLQSHYLCKRNGCCLNCVQWEKQKKKESMKPIKLPRDKVELIRFYVPMEEK